MNLNVIQVLTFLCLKNQKRAELQDDFGETRLKNFEEVINAFKTLGEETCVCFMTSFTLLQFTFNEYDLQEKYTWKLLLFISFLHCQHLTNSLSLQYHKKIVNISSFYIAKIFTFAFFIFLLYFLPTFFIRLFTYLSGQHYLYAQRL